MDQPRTRYALSGAPEAPVSIAWQQFGEGDHDVVMVYGLVSHVDSPWGWPRHGDFLRAIARFARVTHFDKRGVGLSDRLAVAATLEERVEDLLAVMDAAGVQRATLVGASEGAPLAILFAATHPDRVERLALFGGMARTSAAPDYPFAPPKDDLLASALELVVPYWDEAVLIEIFEPSNADDPAAREHWVRNQQQSASPGMVAQLYLMAFDLDVRELLATVRVPTLVMHRRGDRAVPVQAGRWLAAQIPGAQYVELDGNDHVAWAGDQGPPLEHLERFVTGTVAPSAVERSLLTVLFTDIVDSTRRAAALGDAAWTAVLARHNERVTTAVEDHGGQVRKFLGDGVLATFTGPARAVRAGLAARDAVRELGLELRIGAHCGEVEHQGDDIAGIAVHTAARVAATATTGEVWTTSTIADLVAGSGLVFEDRGTHDLKGLDRAWTLAAASEGPAPADLAAAFETLVALPEA